MVTIIHSCIPLTINMINFPVDIAISFLKTGRPGLIRLRGVNCAVAEEAPGPPFTNSISDQLHSRALLILIPELLTPALFMLRVVFRMGARRWPNERNDSGKDSRHWSLLVGPCYNTESECNEIVGCNGVKRMIRRRG